MHYTVQLHCKLYYKDHSRVARFADFIPEKWKSGDIEIACGNVENPGKFG